jgi:hypothetical protein
MAGTLAPFLVAGELLFALAGWSAARVWGSHVRIASPYPLFIGALLAICAFFWDLETNAAMALTSFWPSLTLAKLLATEFNPLTLLFSLAHEGSDFVLGVLLAPTLIILIPKVFRRRP